VSRCSLRGGRGLVRLGFDIPHSPATLRTLLPRFTLHAFTAACIPAPAYYIFLSALKLWTQHSWLFAVCGYSNSSMAALARDIMQITWICAHCGYWVAMCTPPSPFFICHSPHGFQLPVAGMAYAAHTSARLPPHHTCHSASRTPAAATWTDDLAHAHLCCTHLTLSPHTYCTLTCIPHRHTLHLYPHATTALWMVPFFGRTATFARAVCAPYAMPCLSDVVPFFARRYTNGDLRLRHSSFLAGHWRDAPLPNARRTGTYSLPAIISLVCDALRPV